MPRGVLNIIRGRETTEMTTTEATQTITLPASTWLAALDSCRELAAKGDTRPVLCGVRVSVRAEEIVISGTDSHALVSIHVPYTAEAMGEYVLSARANYNDDGRAYAAAIAALRVAARDEKRGLTAQIAITFTDTEATLIIGASRIVIPLLRESYPAVEGFTPAIDPDASFNGRIGFGPALFGRVLGVAEKYAHKSDRTSPQVVRFAFTDCRKPARLDWNGDGWRAVAVVMPLFVDFTD